MTRHTVFLLLLFCIPFVPVYAQTPVLVNNAEFQRDARAAIDSLYNRNRQASDQLLDSWKQLYPEHPVWDLFDAMDMWWEVLSDLDDDSQDEELFDKMRLADQRAGDLLDREPGHADGLIIQAVANGYIARQLSNRNRWFASITTARRAQNAHEKLGEVAPDLSDNLFAEGLKKYYAAYLPEAYPVVRAIAWLLPEGNKRQGLELLEITSQDAIFARPESIYFLGNIHLNYEENYSRAGYYFRQLVEMYPNNSYYRRLLVRAYFQHNEDQLALEAIENALEHWALHGIQNELLLNEELLYWRGRIRLRTMQYRAALFDLEESFQLGTGLPNVPHRTFHVMSGYYAGIAAERVGDLSKAREYYQAVAGLEAESDVRGRAEERMDELPR